MPTPDHQFLLEMGLSSSSFENERAGLSYFDAAEKLRSINPNLVSIKVYDVHKNVFTKGGVYRDPLPDLAHEEILDTVLATRSDFVVESDPHTTLK
jgi:hypothetical protein